MGKAKTELSSRQDIRDVHRPLIKWSDYTKIVKIRALCAQDHQDQQNYKDSYEPIVNE